jgi:hypothetical protein
MDEILPCGGAEWQDAQDRFNKTMVGLSNRSAESLEAKWKKCKGVKKSTGDPTCPPNVLRAKVCIHMYHFLILFQFIERHFSHLLRDTFRILIFLLIYSVL